jgi:hypothetical protein
MPARLDEAFQIRFSTVPRFRVHFSAAKRMYMERHEAIQTELPQHLAIDLSQQHIREHPPQPSVAPFLDVLRETQLQREPGNSKPPTPASN